jgi:hypothetical protein
MSRYVDTWIDGADEELIEDGYGERNTHSFNLILADRYMCPQIVT